jgi:hypothetical protein
LWWFNYCDHSGRLLGALILDSPSLGPARTRAGVEGANHGAQYCEGYELDRESANMIPTAAIGHMLDREEVRQLIQELARLIPKRRAAASDTRRGAIRTRTLH